VILKYILLVLLILVLALVLFFMFSVLFPAMKAQSFPVDNLLFSDIELYYVIPDEVPIVKTGKFAVVLCSPGKKFEKKRLYYQRGQTCALINELYESLNDCKYSCIGLGDCENSCSQEAIIIENGTAVITQQCTGCGQCISVCPKHIIKLFSEGTEKCTLCNIVDNSIPSCSDCGKEQNIPVRQKKGFKIWQLCYRILNR
jgi:Na+-translocating ferredoxin:NAD+ oxidoreductase subunit B